MIQCTVPLLPDLDLHNGLCQGENEMAELKTRQNDGDVNNFLNSVESETMRADSKILMALMNEITGAAPKMWGTSIIGFGHYDYINKSGRSGQWMITGFSPRKSALSIYVMQGFGSHADLMKKLGRHKTGRSCLYVKKLDDIDLDVLATLLRRSADFIQSRYGITTAQQP